MLIIMLMNLELSHVVWWTANTHNATVFTRTIHTFISQLKSSLNGCLYL